MLPECVRNVSSTSVDQKLLNFQCDLNWEKIKLCRKKLAYLQVWTCLKTAGPVLRSPRSPGRSGRAAGSPGDPRGRDPLRPPGADSAPGSGLRPDSRGGASPVTHCAGTETCAGPSELRSLAGGCVERSPGALNFAPKGPGS